MTRCPLLVVVLVLVAGCGGSLPDPKIAALEYADAAARGDSDAVYALLSESSKRDYTSAEVKGLVGDQRDELKLQAEAVRKAFGAGADPSRVVTEAMVPFADGERAALRLEQGEYRIGAADALPADARTVAQALGQLRRVIARRSYQGLLRVLTPRSRAAIEEDLRTLVDGLEEPDGLDVKVTGDIAVVTVPGGHFVRLKRDVGVWRIEDFD